MEQKSGKPHFLLMRNSAFSLAFGVAWTLLLIYMAEIEARLTIKNQSYLHYVSNHSILAFIVFNVLEAVLFASLATFLVSRLHPPKLGLYGALVAAPLVVATIINAVTLEAVFWSMRTSLVLFLPTAITILFFVVALRIFTFTNSKRKLG